MENDEDSGDAVIVRKPSQSAHWVAAFSEGRDDEEVGFRKSKDLVFLSPE